MGQVESAEMDMDSLRALVAHLEAAERIAFDLELDHLGFAWETRFIEMIREAGRLLSREELAALDTWQALSSEQEASSCS